MEAQDIIDTLENNNTKCLVCGNTNFTVETLDKNVIHTVTGNKEQKDQGVIVSIAKCQSCGYLLLFDDRQTNLE